MNSHIVSFLRQHKNAILLSITISLTDTLCTFSILIYLGYLLVHITAIDQQSGAFIFISLFFLIISSSLLSHLNDFQFKSINDKLTGYFSEVCWEKILSLPLSTVKTINSYELTKKLSDFETSLSSLLPNIFSFFSNAALLLFLFIYLLYRQTYLATFYLFIFLMMLTFKIAFLIFYDKKMTEYASQKNQSHLLLNESILQIDKIRTTHSENIIIQKYLKVLSLAKKTLQKANDVENYIWIIETMSLAAILLATYYNSIDLIFLLCAAQLILLYEKIGTDLLSLSKSITNLKRFSPFLRTPIKHLPNLDHPDFHGDIKLISVSFNALNNINLHIPAGYFIGLTGASGAGKSTLLKLIIGLETAYTGTILLDGHNIANYNLDKLRQQIGVVTQTSSLFSGTIFSNISANSNITLDEAWQLAKDIGLADEIVTMPMQMFTYISDNASDSISGGQRQKILLARALATRPKVLLLDEPTSALDETSQAVIFNYLGSLNITRFVIAHRLSTLQGADFVYHLDNGGIMV